MKTETIVLAATLLAFAGGAAQAQTTARSGTGLLGNSRLYGELGYSHLDVSGTGAGVSVSGHPGVLRGIVGYDFHPNLAGEAMLGFGVRDADFSGTALGVPFTGDVKVQNTFGLFAKPKLDVGNAELFGRLGWARSKVKSDVRVGGTSTSVSDTDSDFAYGVGANWRFTPTTYVGLDFMRYFDKDQTKVDGLTLSVGMRW